MQLLVVREELCSQGVTLFENLKLEAPTAPAVVVRAEGVEGVEQNAVPALAAMPEPVKPPLDPVDEAELLKFSASLFSLLICYWRE